MDDPLKDQSVLDSMITLGSSEREVTFSACENSDYSRNGSKPGERVEDVARAVADRRVLLKLTITPELMTKIEHVRTIAWHRLPPRASLEQILEFLVDEFLEAHDPAHREARRARRHKGSATVGGQPAPRGKR